VEIAGGDKKIIKPSGDRICKCKRILFSFVECYLYLPY